uniref:Uncharacterized protein n=1 Tax=Paraburkholderia sprentiae WSM5005 TaxID=754502 RepID=A0A1I9YU77_9BURK
MLQDIEATYFTTASTRLASFGSSRAEFVDIKRRNISIRIVVANDLVWAVRFLGTRFAYCKYSDTSQQQ